MTLLTIIFLMVLVAGITWFFARRGTSRAEKLVMPPSPASKPLTSIPPRPIAQTSNIPPAPRPAYAQPPSYIPRPPMPSAPLKPFEPTTTQRPILIPPPTPKPFTPFTPSRVEGPAPKPFLPPVQNPPKPAPEGRGSPNSIGRPFQPPIPPKI